jgi:folate-binding protein YgfZ
VSQSPSNADVGSAWIQGAGNLALIHFEGGGAAQFLQGYLTCNTSDLDTRHWAPGAFCDIKGRVIANGWVKAVDDGVDCIVHAGLGTALIRFLTIYLRFAKVRARLDGACAFDIGGDASGPDSLNFAVSALTASDASTQALIDSLTATDRVLLTPETSGRFLPQALGLVEAGAVSFDKGCYLGQEVVARAQHRGQVKKNLVRIRWRESLQVQLLDSVTDSNRQKIGTIVQVGTGCALLVADRTIEHDTPCQIGETEVTPDVT